MNIAQFSIEKNRITFLVLAAIMALGVAMYLSMARDSMPPYTVRVASIVSSFPGASPERVEQLVTDKIEKVAQELPELKEVTSTSRTGLSIVAVVLKNEVSPDNMQAVWDRLHRKLDALDGLPSGVEPELNDDGVGDVYGIALAMTSDGFTYAEMKEYADDVRDVLIKLDDAAKVDLGGVQEERVFIEFDNERLTKYNLTASRLQSIIASTNILSSGGKVNLLDERIILEPTGNFNSLDEVRSTLVPVGNGSQLLRLGDITSVSKGYIEPPSQVVSVNGQRAISFHIALKSGSNIVALGTAVDAAVNQQQGSLPVGLELSRIASMDTYIDEKIGDFVTNLFQAIVIVLVVMLVFMGLRTGFVIASLIPIVTVMTLMLMGLLNVGLNQVTLAALIMALGMMVDNAIVVAESVIVRMEGGAPAKQAAIDSASELFMPLLISTLTTSAAFMAFYLAESTMGDIVGPIFVVISLALLSSWLVALTVITMFCVLFLKIDSASKTKPRLIDRIINRLKVYYKDMILWALARNKLVIGLTVIAFVVSLFGFRFIPFIFFPDSDRNLVTVDINLPLGTRIERTMAVTEELERFIVDSLRVGTDRSEGVVDWSAYIGKGPEAYDMGYSAGEANSSYAHMLVNTSSFEVNKEVIKRFDQFAFNAFPDADILVSALGAGGGGTPIEIKVSGAEPDELARIAEAIKIQLTGIRGTKNVKDDWGPKSKKLVIAVDQTRAQTAGVTSKDIATSLRTVLDGFQTGEYREDDKSLPIIMRSDVGQQQTLESLETLSVFAQSSGASVPLLQVADIVPEWQYSKIKRQDLYRTVNVSSELSPDGNASDIMSAIGPWLDEQAALWPSGYSYSTGGDAENTAENMSAVIDYLPLSFVLIILLLVIQFNSFRKTTMVLFTIPLAVIGVVVGLLLFREPFGFMPFLGVISLAGIVINNAIVLLDRIEIEQVQYSRTDQDAIISACLQRFRPILLATFTTVLGLVPLYLSGGEMWEGMAICIMVGLLFGTLITLVLIPSLYSVFYSVDYSGYQFDQKLLA